MNTPKHVGIVGAGQMGAGIAQVSAQAGLAVLLHDSTPGAVDRATAGIEKRLARLVEKGELSAADSKSIRSRVQPASSLTQLSQCEVVIEAIAENKDAKCSLFKELNTILGPEAVLASNTSSISITDMAAASGRADRFIGVHFMNPVPVMKLVEIIRGLQTSDQTYKFATDLVQKFGKTSVLGIDGPGFVVNRILCPMVNEAIFLLQEGVAREDIDTAMMLGTNQPMGPLTLADFVGLDTLLAIMRILHRELGEDKYRPCPLLVKYVEAGWYGKKSGKGFYDYDTK